MLLKFAGMPLNISMGGFAEATFPERDDEQLRALNVGDRFEVRWERAVFVGWHPLLGKVIARLDPDAQEAERRGFVESLQATAPESFFPALNRNYLHFAIEVPRLRLHLRGAGPIVNSAEIDRIPPYGHTYKLERPVPFSASSPIGRAFPSTIETCSVKLVELANLNVKLEERTRANGQITFDITTTNTTTEDKIQVAWMVWPNDNGAEAVSGVINLKRRPKRVSFRVASTLLRTQRWLAIAITRPFTTDAAHAAEFPLLT